MHRYSFLSIGVLFLLLFSGCGRKEVFRQEVVFEQGSWDRFRKLNFEIPIQGDGSYDLILELDYLREIEMDILPIHVIILTPDGEERIQEHELFFSGREVRQQIRKCEGEQCKLELVLQKKLYMEKQGTCRVEIENLYPKMAADGFQRATLRAIK